MKDNSNRAPQGRHEAPVGTVSANGGALEHQIDHERIARRAYELYDARGRADGHADEDWFQATSEYASRQDDDPGASENDDASSSFAERVRNARR
jgi:hypothetical protein